MFQPAPVPLLFCSNGTLIDSNYQHVTAGRGAARRRNRDSHLENPPPHRHERKIFLRELLREIGRRPKGIEVEQLERKHDRIFRRHIRALEPCGNGDLNTVPREVVICNDWSQGLPRQA